MKTRLFLLLVAAALSACQRTPEQPNTETDERRAAEVQELDQKIAELKELERQANERKLAEIEQRARDSEARANSAERQRERLEQERTRLMAERDRLARDQAKAEERARSAEEEAEAQSIDFFYTALEPYGDWLEVDPYGYVWQPRAAADPGWRPYIDGRWVDTEYGWFWKSNEPFGWAVYHYGRWARIRRVGWVWVPGAEWGPAWVSWRRGDRYVGWAPLPPEAWSKSGFTAAVDSYYDIGPANYNFVPLEALAQPTFVGRVVQPEQNVTIVNKTVNVTDVTYKTVQKNVVVYNEGPQINVVAPNTAREIPRMQVERVTRGKGERDPGRAEQRGEKLIVSAPRINQEPRDRKPAAPKKVKERVKGDVERGWSEGDREEAEQARAKVKKEAAEAEEKQRRSEKPRSSEAPVPTAPQKPSKQKEEVRPTSPPPASTPAATPKPTAPVRNGREKPAPPAAPEKAKEKESAPVSATPAKPAATPAVPAKEREKKGQGKRDPVEAARTERGKDRASDKRPEATPPNIVPTATPEVREPGKGRPWATPAAEVAPRDILPQAPDAGIPERRGGGLESRRPVRPDTNANRDRLPAKGAGPTPVPPSATNGQDSAGASGGPEQAVSEAPAAATPNRRQPKMERQRPDRLGTSAGESPSQPQPSADQKRGDRKRERAEQAQPSAR